MRVIAGAQNDTERGRKKKERKNKPANGLEYGEEAQGLRSIYSIISSIHTGEKQWNDIQQKTENTKIEDNLEEAACSNNKYLGEKTQ